MLVFYSDGDPSLWINSIGVCVVTGTALVLSALPPVGLAAMDKWQSARLYRMPPALSSVAAPIRAEGFFVIFSPSTPGNAVALTACIVFAALAAFFCRRCARA